MPAVPPNRPHTPAAMPPPPRPDSPTFNRLLDLAKEERKGKLVVPIVPAQVRRATVEEWGAVNTFAANMHEADSNGLMRRAGEFFQTFTSKPKELDYVANHEIHYKPGDKVDPMPASVFPPGTSEMVHSHPPARGRTGNAFPSAQDYLGTYLINNGNERGIGSILFDVQSGHYFAFEGKVNPNTNLPEFTRITQPSHQDNNEWMIKHGHMVPPTPPRAGGRPMSRNHSEEMFFGPMDGV